MAGKQTYPTGKSFQFHKVRLKVQAELGYSNKTVMFQFHKVRLKAFIRECGDLFLTSFNSIRYD